MDADFVNSLQGLSFDSCKSAAIAEIANYFQQVAESKQNTVRQKARYNRLVYDVESARSKDEVIRICYQLVLASEGLLTQGSKWNKFYTEM
jgi:hypothetical protein